MLRSLIGLSAVLSILLFGLFSCAGDSPSGPTGNMPAYGLTSSIRSEAVSLKVAFDTTPATFSQIDTTTRFGRTSLIVVSGLNDLQDKVVRKVEVFYDGAKVYEDTCGEYWFGLDVIHGQLDDRDALVIIGGRQAPVGSFSRAKLVFDGRIINLLPEGLVYPVYDLEDFDWSANLPSCWGFDIRMVDGKVVYGVSMGVYHSFRDNAVYWFSVDLTSCVITQHGCSGPAD
jgi:hypothetical protein